MNREIRKIYDVSKMFFEISNAISKCYSTHSNTCGLKVNEGLVRTAVSRAYYAVFFLIREALGLRNVSDHTVHMRIVNRLLDDGYPELANKVKQLRDKRNQADYSIYFSLSPETFERIIHLANTVIIEIQNKYPHNLPKTDSRSHYIQ